MCVCWGDILSKSSGRVSFCFFLLYFLRLLVDSGRPASKKEQTQVSHDPHPLSWSLLRPPPPLCAPSTWPTLLVLASRSRLPPDSSSSVELYASRACKSEFSSVSLQGALRGRPRDGSAQRSGRESPGRGPVTTPLVDVGGCSRRPQVEQSGAESQLQPPSHIPGLLLPRPPLPAPRSLFKRRPEQDCGGVGGSEEIKRLHSF